MFRRLGVGLVPASAKELQQELTRSLLSYLRTAEPAAAVLKIDVFASFRSLILDLPNRLEVTGWNPLWFGLCAGVGEELLFRGALQPLVGIWWTGLLFTLAHAGTGGLKSMNRMKWGYAAFLFLTSLMFSMVLIQWGLIADVVLHAVGDGVIFFVLRGVAARQLSRVS